MQCTIHSSTAAGLAEAVEEVFANEQVTQAAGGVDFVMVALSDRYPDDAVHAAIGSALGETPYLAFHSTDTFHGRSIVNDGLTALFFSFEREGRVSCFVGRDVSMESDELLEETVAYLQKHRDAAHLIIAGVCHNKMAFFVDQLNQHDVPIDNIIGGLSSGAHVGEEIRTYQFYQGEIIRDGFVIVTLHDVEMASSIAMGFEPIGIQYTITQAEGYRVYDVDDGNPFAATIEKLMEHIDPFEPSYLWYTPVVILEDGKTQEVKTLRTFRQMTSEWVEFYGPIKEGQLIKLSYGDAEHLLEADRESIQTLTRTLPAPEVLINFSCIARQYVLEERQEAENGVYLDAVDVPLFGFFTFGEIGRDVQKKSLQFYNETSLLIGMRER